MMNIGFPLLEQNTNKAQISVKQPQEIDQSWNYTHSKMWFCPKWDSNQILSNQYQVYDIKQPYLFSTNLINKWKFNHWGSFSSSS